LDNLPGNFIHANICVVRIGWEERLISASTGVPLFKPGAIAFRPIVRERFARRSLNVLPIENAKRPFVNNKS
jgi:hypothetical protein